MTREGEGGRRLSSRTSPAPDGEKLSAGLSFERKGSTFALNCALCRPKPFGGKRKKEVTPSLDVSLHLIRKGRAWSNSSGGSCPGKLKTQSKYRPTAKEKVFKKKTKSSLFNCRGGARRHCISKGEVEHYLS